MYAPQQAPRASDLRSHKRRGRKSTVIEALEERTLLALQPTVQFTDADFNRMRAGVSAGTGPIYNGWTALISDGYSQLGASPRPLATVIRGGSGENFNQMVIDIQRTYQLALRWQITRDTRYADLAVTFLNSWSSTNTSLTGNADRFLASGLYGYDWAVAADIMKGYSGWAAADVTRFQNYLVSVYYPLQHDFLVNHNTAAITNYWANWDLANLEGMMAVGIFANRSDLYDEAVNYLYNGGGNGALAKVFYYRHPGNFVQYQESGRDQGHSVLGMQLFGHIAQMAWNQGLDLYGYDNNAYLGALEYVAKYNLGQNVPYTTYSWGTGQTGQFQTQTAIGAGSRGDRDVGFMAGYAHYAQRLGIAAPNTAQRIALIGTEGRGSGDEMGFGTLTYSLTPISTVGLKPQSLTAAEKGRGQIELNWFGTVNATGYNVYRATSAGSTYTKIASNVTGVLTYTDVALPAGLYYYKVTGVAGVSETAASAVVAATSTTLPHTTLAFDENTGTTAGDSTGNGHTAALSNGATWTAGKSGSALSLDGTNDFLQFATDVLKDANDFTVSAWVKLNNTGTWSRIFDFGDARGRWMYLAVKNGSGQMEFGTSTVYGYNKQAVAGGTIPNNTWTHVAVTFADHVATLYINGQSVAANVSMDFPPSQIGGTTRNWIGRSQFASDPYLKGAIDDFRISRGAMTAGELYTLATGLAAPPVPTAPSSLSATAVAGGIVNLSWPAISGATGGYSVRRATNLGGPYTTLAVRMTGTSFSDTGRLAGTAYYYVVTAANSGGDSANSPVANVVALPPLPSAPGTVTAKPLSSSSIGLSWTAGINATTYTISRSTTAGGPYTTVISGLAATTYNDTGRTPGTTYFYIVTAVNAAGSSVSPEVAATPADLLVQLKFNETAGISALDATGNSWNGTLTNGPIWTAGHQNGGVKLDGADDFVSLPAGVINGLTTATFATWVNVATFATWSRFFDFGTGTTNYLFLTPQYTGASPNNAKLRFAIRTSTIGEQQITSSVAMPANTWAHVAVVLNGTSGTLYLNGTQVGQNNAMTLNPSSLGSTTLNFLGKSQFADPYLNGSIDDFRIYNRPLSGSEVSALANALVPAAPVPTATPGDGHVTLTWPSVAGATKYNLKRASVNGGPYTTIASGLTALAYVDSGLANYATYYYVVSAANVADESPNSVQVLATPISATGSPSAVVPANATPNPTNGSTASLSVLGADDGPEANLTYTWAAIGALPAPVTFSVNGSNGAKSTTATFTRAGTYLLLVTLTDADGHSAISRVSVVVSASAANGGFETPSVGGLFAYRPTGGTWSFAGNAGIAADGSGFNVGTGHGGTQVALIQSAGAAGTGTTGVTGSITQNVNFAAPGTYTISFEAAQRIRAANVQGIRVLVDGVSVLQVTPGSTAFSTFISDPFTITSPGNHSIVFIGTDGTGDQTAFIDDVALNLVPAIPSVITGSEGADTWYLKSSGDGQRIEIGIGDGTAVPIYVLDKSDLTELTFDLLGGDDKLIVNGGLGGDPLLDIDLTYLGGSGNDTLVLENTTGAPMLFSDSSGYQRLVVDGGTFAGESDLSQYTANLTLAASGGASVAVTASQIFRGVSIAGANTTMNVAANGSRLLQVGTNGILITDGGKLVLNDNGLAVEGASLAAIKSLVIGAQIVSTSADLALGYASADAVLSGNTFMGQTIAPPSVLVRGTYSGDANLDGAVNFSDLLAMAQNYGAADRSWSQGDFDGDGSVNFSDLLQLAQNYGRAAPAVVSAEVASLSNRSQSTQPRKRVATIVLA